MDVIDFAGNVVTPPDRTIDVWRAVPTVENSAITAPYQYDGRKGTLQEQAQGAVTAHSQGGTVAQADLDAIAAFQQEQFTSNRARKVAKKLAKGVPVEEIERPELSMKLDRRAGARARDLQHRVRALPRRRDDRSDHQPRGSRLRVPRAQARRQRAVRHLGHAAACPCCVPQPNNEFLNIGLANLSTSDSSGSRAIFNSTVALPQYRYRFYTDGTRTVPGRRSAADPGHSGPDTPSLPPLDENGAPIVGPNFLPQFFSTDPGRAAITGDPHDFEAFDVPALRGIANTAPYFHDNSAETLRDAVNIYSRFILQFFPMLNLPLVNPPEEGGFFPESFTPAQKDDLIAFLRSSEPRIRWRAAPMRRRTSCRHYQPRRVFSSAERRADILALVVGLGCQSQPRPSACC